ncbi:MAG: MASE3 domain-containing protein [Thermoplasmatota archaeon]
MEKIESKKVMIYSLLIILSITVLYVINLFNYLLYHSLVEIFSILVSFSIFIIAFNSRKYIKNNFFIFIGTGYLFIGSIDLIHTLAYKGMGVFPGYGANLPTQLWIAARFMEASILCLGLILLSFKKEIDFKKIFFGFLSIFILLMISIFYIPMFPDCYIEGSGLTLFKKVSEYIISIILVFALFILYKNKQKFSTYIYTLLSISIILTILSEIAFTFYVGVYDLSNMVGHIFKLISFVLIYESLISTGIRKPFSLLFKDIKEKEKQLEKDLKERKRIEKREEFLHSLLRHDLKNKLMVAEGYLQLLKENDLEKDLRGYVDRTSEVFKQSMDIIEKVRELRKIEYENVKQFDIKKKIKKVLDENREKANDKDIELDLECDLERCEVKGGELIKTVFTNLIGNAIKHGNCETIKIRIHDEKDRCVISVEDDGTGISDKNKDKIFKKGFKAGEKAGTGLGLYLVKKIIENYGGEIKIKDSELGGARFDICLNKYNR